MNWSPSERAMLRDVALKVAEIAADPVQERTADLWRRLNRLERTRPLIMLYDWTQHETGHKVELVCQDEELRKIELELKDRIYRWRNMRDDQVWGPVYYSDMAIHSTGYGMETDETLPDHVFGARRYNGTLEDDSPPSLLPMPLITVDREESERRYQSICDLFGDILDVQMRGATDAWCQPMDEFIQWRGIEKAMTDMLDRPEWLHSWLDRIITSDISRVEQYEKLGVLHLNNGESFLYTGGHGCTDELPAPDFDPARVRTKDVWGLASTQIFSDVSPAMHEEFALRYERRFLSRFGLAYYGCCEPLHAKIDLILKHIPNVRKISMSPWADVEAGAAAMGKRAVFSYKPNPAILGLPDWNPDAARKQLRDVFEKTRDCVVEVTMKDLHTVRGEVNRMSEWISMAKELAEEYA